MKTTVKERRNDYLDKTHTLWEVILKEGAVCRHLVGLVHVYLLKHDIDSDILGTKDAIDNEMQSFLNVHLIDYDYFVYPALGFVFRYNNAKEEIETLGKPSKHHFPNRKAKIKFLY